MINSATRWTRAALRALVRDNEVHRAVYTDPEIFNLEMSRLFRSTWV
ncbi:MAG: hypothetical protein RL458_1615, partial [Pseudomonadota bacterium]